MSNLMNTAANTADPDITKMVIVAGLLGSLLSMSFMDEMSNKQRVIAIFSGGIMTHYLTPMIAFLFHEEQYQQTIGFLIGLFGMSICAAIFRAIKNSDLWDFFVKRFSKGNI